MCLAISIAFLQPTLSFAPALMLLAPFTYHAWAQQDMGVCGSLNQRKEHQVNANQFTSVVAGLMLTGFSVWLIA